MRPTELFPLFANVTTLKGVGSAIQQSLARLIHGDEQMSVTLRDVLFQLPIGIVDRRFSPPLHSAPADTICTFKVKVEAHYPAGAPMRYASKKPYRVLCSNETGDLMLVFFHAAKDYVEKALPVGSERIISGKTEKFDFRLQITHPDIIAPVADLDKVQVVEPQYGLTAGITNKKLRNIIAQALEQLPDLPEWLPEYVVNDFGGLRFKAALTNAHYPQTEMDILPTVPARARLAFDELVAEQIALSNAREKNATQEGILLPEVSTYWDELKQQLPFDLTVGQQEMLAEIGAGLASGARYVRLLQGDVGSGKTVIALFAMLRAVEHGHQAALMVPTEIVAQQHYKRILQMCSALGVRVVLLSGSVKGAERKQVLAQIDSGEAQIVIGTHALFQERVNFKSLALAVIDEQHRFGVEQRMALVNKGDKPHLLHMTATPIPRSLMMTLYGDMQALILKDKPHGRKPITTRVIPLSRGNELLERLDAVLVRGEKAYWICPQIDSASADEQLFEQDIAAAELRFIEFRARFGKKVALVHGRMHQSDRESAMQSFADGDGQLLVATTVIEVGVDVPDATIMIIERAERFGLSQLHQLRGRVGRSDKESFCILLYADNAGEDARERLLTLRNNEDGFAIAEVDFKLRGGGELLGKRQAGQKHYRLAVPEHCSLMLNDAHRIADQIKNKDAAELVMAIFR